MNWDLDGRAAFWLDGNEKLELKMELMTLFSFYQIIVIRDSIFLL
jgi:hypothetical protein